MWDCISGSRRVVERCDYRRDVGLPSVRARSSFVFLILRLCIVSTAWTSPAMLRQFPSVAQVYCHDSPRKLVRSCAQIRIMKYWFVVIRFQILYSYQSQLEIAQPKSAFVLV